MFWGGGGTSKYATSQILTRLDQSTRTSVSETFQTGVIIAIAYSSTGSVFSFRLGLVSPTAPTNQGTCSTACDPAASREFKPLFLHLWYCVRVQTLRAVPMHDTLGR